MQEPRYIRAMRRALHELTGAYGVHCPLTEELRLAIKDVKAVTASARRDSEKESPSVLLFRFKVVRWPQSEP